MKLVKNNFSLLLIIFLAAILRIFQLGSIPIGFNDDEAAFGYTAYSVSQSGRDEWGSLLPFPVFESFGDWKLAGYLYPTVISQIVFGPTEFATRLPSAIIGILAVFACYLLARELFTKGIGLISSLLLAISPWHIVASRNAFESDIQIFFITLAAYLFIKSLKNKKILSLSFIIFAVNFYIYRSSWLFVPLFVSALIILHRDKLKSAKKILVKNILIAVIILTPLIPAALTFKGQSRFFQESIISGVQKSGIIDDLNQKRGFCQERLPEVPCRIIYNKYSAFLIVYFNNYISNLSPETYFAKGTPGGYQAFSTRSLFYQTEASLTVIGLALLILRRHKSLKIILPWIFLAPIGASFTGVGNPGRLNILMPTFQIISAYGLVSAVKLINSNQIRKAVVILTIFIVSFSLIQLVVDMFIYYPKISGRFQRYGYKQLFDYLQEKRTNYSQVAISRRSDDAKQYIHYLFYERINPNLFFDNNYSIKYRGSDTWRVVDKIGNLVFYQSAPDPNRLPPKSLLVVAGNEVFYKTKPIFDVKYLNGDIAFEVYEVEEIKRELKLKDENN